METPPKKIQIKTNNIDERNALLTILYNRGIKYSYKQADKEGFYLIEYTDIVK